MLCGFGEHQGRTVAYAAQAGTATRPAGYRTAIAGKWRPITSR